MPKACSSQSLAVPNFDSTPTRPLQLKPPKYAAMAFMSSTVSTNSNQPDGPRLARSAAAAQTDAPHTPLQLSPGLPSQSPDGCFGIGGGGGRGGGGGGSAGGGGGAPRSWLSTWHSTGALAEQLARAPATLPGPLHDHVLQVVGGDGGG